MWHKVISSFGNRLATKPTSDSPVAMGGLYPASATTPVVLNFPDPALRRYVMEICALMQPMDVEGGELVRKGRPFDGGYVMLSHDDIAGSNVYSLGIADDVSWDSDMAALGCEIFQYDHTIEGLPVSNPRFHFSKLGIAALNTPDGKFKTVDQLVIENQHQRDNQLILKMDIEGSEWRVFEAMPPETLSQFSQILVEFHQFLGVGSQSHMSLVAAVLRKLHATHQVIHVHANNYGWIGLVAGMMVPDTLEITYVRRSDHQFRECERIFPTPIDMPCDPKHADYYLGALGCEWGAFARELTDLP